VNRVLRGMFGSNWYETMGWRKLHTEELHNLYPSATVSYYADQIKGGDSMGTKGKDADKNKCKENLGRKP
jgi:hypothetical protein